MSLKLKEAGAETELIVNLSNKVESDLDVSVCFTSNQIDGVFPLLMNYIAHHLDMFNMRKDC